MLTPRASYRLCRMNAKYRGAHYADQAIRTSSKDLSRSRSTFFPPSASANRLGDFVEVRARNYVVFSQEIPHPTSPICDVVDHTLE
jgi:hypothetical protein